MIRLTFHASLIASTCIPLLNLRTIDKQKISPEQKLPLRSIQTTESHWIEWPSLLCQNAILAACQLPKPGSTSLYVGILACIILAIPFPCDNTSPVVFKLTCCICLLCFPLTLGYWIPVWNWIGLPRIFLDDTCITLLRIFSHVFLVPLEHSETSTSSSSSDLAANSFTESSVISSAESAACSHKNWKDAPRLKELRQMIIRVHPFSIQSKSILSLSCVEHFEFLHVGTTVYVSGKQTCLRAPDKVEPHLATSTSKAYRHHYI